MRKAKKLNRQQRRLTFERLLRAGWWRLREVAGLYWIAPNGAGLRAHSEGDFGVMFFAPIGGGRRIVVCRTMGEYRDLLQAVAGQ